MCRDSGDFGEPILWQAKQLSLSSLANLSVLGNQNFCRRSDLVLSSPTCRVSSDLENLKISGNFDARTKCQGKVREFCYVKFIFSQSEHPDFENFPGEHASISS